MRANPEAHCTVAVSAQYLFAHCHSSFLIQRLSGKDLNIRNPHNYPRNQDVEATCVCPQMFCSLKRRENLGGFKEGQFCFLPALTFLQKSSSCCTTVPPHCTVLMRQKWKIMNCSLVHFIALLYSASAYTALFFTTLIYTALSLKLPHYPALHCPATLLHCCTLQNQIVCSCSRHWWALCSLRYFSVQFGTFTCDRIFLHMPCMLCK